MGMEEGRDNKCDIRLHIYMKCNYILIITLMKDGGGRGTASRAERDGVWAGQVWRSSMTTSYY
jgi:hypothetical protein